MITLSWLEPDEVPVIRALSRSARVLFAQLDRELQRDVGMPRTYFEILWLVRHAPNRAMRMSELAEVTESTPSRITHAVSRLEEAGYLRREAVAGDRRGWLAILTDDGETALGVAGPRHAESIRKHLLAPLTVEQQTQLVEIGETLMAHFAEVKERAKSPVGAAS